MVRVAGPPYTMGYLLLLDGQVVEQGRVLRLQLSHGTFEVELGRGVEWLLGQGAGRRGQRGRWGQEPGQGHAPVVLLGGDVVGCVLPLAAGSEKTISCLDGIFDLSKHIIFS